MKKYLTVLASFLIMLCIGSVYAWSIVASELMADYNFSAAQSQIIFGTIIAIFPITMIFVGQIAQKIKVRYLGFISGTLFFVGYFMAGSAQGNFILSWIGLGVLAGIATGFGYWMSLTVPVQWFPEKKGLITGIAAAGFGLGAVFMSEISGRILDSGKDVLELLRIIGIAYGAIIVTLTNLINRKIDFEVKEKIQITKFLKTSIFGKLCFGIFLGTFAGLLIIGSLKIIGEQSQLTNPILILGVSLFAVANFLGRLTWGFLSDHLGASLNIFFALMVQSISILLLNIIPLTEVSYLILSFVIGFGFGGNFVLFAKETAHVFSLKNLGIVYPYVFGGYAIAGIIGPFSGGFLFDLSGNFTSAIILASVMSLFGSLLFLYHHLKTRKTNTQIVA